MATRHNTCRNPGLKVDNTGWTDTPTSPLRVTGLTGFPRTTGARLDNGSLLKTQVGSVTAGLTYTLSCYMRPEVVSRTGPYYIEWTNGVGGKTYTTSSFNIPSGTVTRLSLTDVAPAGAVTAAMMFEGGSYSFNPTVATAVLIEESGSAGTYFDGDTSGAAWDGTDGLSASTLTDIINLVIANASQAQSAQSLALVQAHLLAIANANQSQLAQNMTLTQVHKLGIQSAHQAQSATSIGNLLPITGSVSGKADANPIREGASTAQVIALAGTIE